MNLKPNIVKRSNSTIDLIFTINVEEILNNLNSTHSKGQRGRPFKLPAEIMEEFWTDVDQKMPTKALSQKFGLSISNVNRLKRLRRNGKVWQ